MLVGASASGGVTGLQARTGLSGRGSQSIYYRSVPFTPSAIVEVSDSD